MTCMILTLMAGASLIGYAVGRVTKAMEQREQFEVWEKEQRHDDTWKTINHLDTDDSDISDPHV